MLHFPRAFTASALPCTAVVCTVLLYHAASSAAVDAAGPSPQQTADRIDKLLWVETVASQPDKPTPAVNDEQFLRRVYLDITGTPPPAGKLVAFVLDPAKDKRHQAVKQLLASSEYGKNWARYWRDVIFFRRTEDRALLGARATEQFLAEKFNENARWDQIATAFITATGDVQKNGATGLIMAQAGRPEETVSEISRIFMGVQIQCAQCHDHPTDRWKREQFHQLAAFFPRVAVRPDRSSDRRSFLVAVTDYSFGRGRQNANNRFRGTLEHYMPNLEDPASKGELMQPVFFATGDKLDSATRDATRRKQLADWLTSSKNEWFATAMVNRMWSEMVGEAFYLPVDDIGPDRSPSAPETVKALSQAFAESGYDVKWLIETISLTRVYQQQSRSRRNPGETPFKNNCNQRLRGDQLFNALSVTLDIPSSVTNNRPRNLMGGYRVNTSARNIFNRAFGYDPSDPREEAGGSIPQSLFMMNSTLINGLLSSRRSTGIGQLLREIKDDETLVVELYLKALSREPAAGEIKTCLQYVKDTRDRNQAFEDIAWALVNSSEFAYRR